MSRERDQLTEKHLSNLKKRIQDTLRSKGIDNTGEASDSLEVDGNKLLGADYLYFLDKGRGPGRFPPVDNIRDWVRKKLGLDGKEADSVAYLVGRKISNEGTTIFKDKSKGLELDAMVDEMINELFKELPDVVALEVEKWA